jgi:hypothetical protein
MSFTKYFNQAASKLDNGPLWEDFSSRSLVNLEMLQLLEEWHNTPVDGDRRPLETIIKEKSLENNLLTPFVTLHVAKPGLKNAMRSGFNLADFGDFDFRKKREADEPSGNFQELKFRHRGHQRRNSSSESYIPMLCGTSDLLAFAKTENFEEETEFFCFDPAELEFDQLEIYRSDNINVTGTLRFGQLNQILVEALNETVNIKLTGEGSMVELVRNETIESVPFGHFTGSQISTSRFGNFTAVYFNSHMLGVEVSDTIFQFQIGRLSDKMETASWEPQADMKCFQHQISTNHCLSHDLTPGSTVSSERRTRRGRKIVMSLDDFNTEIQKQL